jgi:hypothetical protein
MSSMAVDGLATSAETGPEQLPASPRLALAESPAPAPLQCEQPRPLEVAQCALCGIARPLGLLVPDGSQACADIRWYCKDAKSCTERWTTACPPRRAPTPLAPGTGVEGAGEPAPDTVPAAPLDGMLEEARSTE